VCRCLGIPSSGRTFTGSRFSDWIAARRRNGVRAAARGTGDESAS